MSTSRILIERGIGQIRAIALDAKGQAISTYVQRDSHLKHRAAWATLSEAVVRELAPAQGGAFVELSHGETALLGLDQGKPPALGSRHTVRIASEARRDKLARVVRVSKPSSASPSAFEAWKNALPQGSSAEITECDADDAIDATFDEALSPTVTIPGGGRLRFSPTPALLAIDIDTAGRNDKGRAVVRADTINRAALTETARQLALRRAGGAVIVDCVGPLPPTKRGSLKVTFSEAWQQISTHRISVLAPSAFGLLQASLTRHATPLDELMLDDTGQPTPETNMLDGLRQLLRVAMTERAAQLTLRLPAPAFASHQSQAKAHMTALINRFGARIEIVPNMRDQIEVLRS